MKRIISDKETASFADYCWNFYGPNGIYSDYFQPSLTREELAEAIAAQTAKTPFYGDTADREAVRDILLGMRNGPKWREKSTTSE